MKYNFFTVKYLLSCSMSVVLTVKVEGLIRPPLAQMASTKACYKLRLKGSYNYWAESVVLSGLKSYENWYMYDHDQCRHSFAILDNNLRQLQSLWNTILREIRSFQYFFSKRPKYYCLHLPQTVWTKSRMVKEWSHWSSPISHTVHINFHNF